MARDGLEYPLGDEDAYRFIEPKDLPPALGLLADNGYVTRMYTKNLPHEMTVDPFSHLSGDVGSDGLVGLTSDIVTRNVTRNVPCSGRQNTTLPDGRYVELPVGTWPDIAPDEMPWVQLIEERPGPDMPPITLVDNTMLIDELLDAHNLEADKVEPQPKPRFRCDDWNPEQDEDGGAAGGCGCRAPAPPARC